MGSIRLVAVGDVIVTRSLLRGARPAPVQEELARLWSLLRGADVCFTDIEIPLTRRGAPVEKLMTHRADPALAAELREIGIAVSQIAHNHAFDFGVEGFLDTLEVLQDAGIQVVGGGRDLDEALKPAVLTVGGVRLAFLGFSSLLPVGSAASVGRPGIAPVRVRTWYEVDPSLLEEQPGTPPAVHTAPVPSDVLLMQEAIRSARQVADVVVVGVHWGVYMQPVVEYQQALAHAIVEAGADLVVGNHPHLIQPIEFYRQKAIFYNLNNFVTHIEREEYSVEVMAMLDGMSRDGLILEADFDGPAIARMTVRPIRQTSDGDPLLATGRAAAEILGDLAGISEPYGGRVVIEGDQADVVAL